MPNEGEWEEENELKYVYDRIKGHLLLLITIYEASSGEERRTSNDPMQPYSLAEQREFEPQRLENSLGVVRKLRNAKIAIFLPPPPVT